MKGKSLKNLVVISLAAFLLNFFLPALSFGQQEEDAAINIVVSRTPFLSFTSLPTSFAFNNVTTALQDQQVFSNTDGDLDRANRLLEVRDTRNSGGFIVQAQSTNLQSSPDVIESSNLRIVSSTATTPAIDDTGTTLNGVVYLTGYTGTPDAGTTQTVDASVNTENTNFGQVGTFDDVPDNSLDAPVDILSGCLQLTEGRDGSIATALAYTLTVPAYTPSGEYSAIITYTISDCTTESPIP